MAFVEGRLAAEEVGGIDEHLDGCSVCRKLVAAAAKVVFESQSSVSGPGRSPSPDASPPSLAPGTTISRYVVERMLGSGAAGLVYEAHDPKLKRKVALKLLRPGQPNLPHQNRRLLREAETMAQLAHPNVVNVFDAGTVVLGGIEHVFIVMELVPGDTLAAWLGGAPRGWREVLSAFAQAGRGLAAAHAASLVHRDFKPENVLVGSDGRVRVTDFGLARSTTATERVTVPETAASADLPDGGKDAKTAVAGTPIYMAPEQFLGATADAGTDQFAYCVALFLGLYGRHPRGGSIGDLAALARTKRGDDPEILVPTKTNVPRLLGEIIVRGLSTRPAGRHRSMDALVTALDDVLSRHSRRNRGVLLAGIAAAAVAAAALGAVLSMRGTPAPVCGNGTAETGEECDDGNASDADGCLATCRLASCGDGRLRLGVEECDDGNQADNDGCAYCLRCTDAPDSAVGSKTGHCYRRHDGPVSWAEAQGTCGALGGYLVTYASFHESRLVRSALLDGRDAPTWIGLAVTVNGRLEWIAGDGAFHPGFWAAGEPRTGAGACAKQLPVERLEEPANARPGVLWALADCQAKHGFVCERTGWTVHPKTSHAYRVFWPAVSFARARLVCIGAGGHLIDIADAQEQAFVASLAGQSSFWIGATDAAEHGRFLWTDGQPVVFSAFNAGEPDDPAQGRCVVFGPGAIWHDRVCTIDLQAAGCEIDR